ncbi:MAG TPA: S1C family serine protease [Candidatus Enterocloster excrementigallinarum]|uniref:S1C family serine protease n=1 Tax=Candidatus Enterocloster excrementigallinarum TaxID=2838558 RepID=A0A9D2TE56_9FIRM|nr:S1C family serine protease [Candidatus Enterocloster excrementigallinarum]
MPEKNGDRHFIKEKIVRQPMSRRQIARRILLTAFCGVLFGVVAGVCFAVSRPIAERHLGLGETEESQRVTIPKDEPETTAPPAPTTTADSETESEPVGDVVQSEIAKYTYEAADVDRIFAGLRSVASEADQGIVSVHSIQHQTDWFDNPIETTGQHAGVLIAKMGNEGIILTTEAAIESADSIEVALADGTVLEGAVKQRDTVADMAVVSIDLSTLSQEQRDKLPVIELGNSYSVKQGDLVVAVGSPAGVIHSTDYGVISYVVRNVQLVDGVGRVFYTSVNGAAREGTFLINLNGQLIGWVTEAYANAQNSGMAAVAGVSDYKAVLEDLSNGVAPPYFGIRGQEVSREQVESGMPAGIYVVESVSDGPAYNAGIQNGDIITSIGEASVATMKEFQNQLDLLSSGDRVRVMVQRNGTDMYRELEFTVEIRGR